MGMEYASYSGLCHELLKEPDGLEAGGGGCLPRMQSSEERSSDIKVVNRQMCTSKHKESMANVSFRSQRNLHAKVTTFSGKVCMDFG
ncbi:hypothetical protein Cadr_000027381 [Camelus dromedarius]|uniref:Uncharacterized protein n=1 Tax=Camelus dromedarius TaxID=9838 RepID=A0A5N4CC25_CAMDR|nr:hypothetical protein Cadr_000027381 [Camelus dromedarius]